MQGKERPMLYSTDMVVSILEDRKTKTRRMKGLGSINEDPDSWHWRGTISYTTAFHVAGNPTAPKKNWGVVFTHRHTLEETKVKCPYGQPGDILWVRETWALNKYFNGLTEACFPIFKADYHGPVDWNWKPSIHMPKAAARIWLHITDIRIERVQSITPGDADLEGVESWNEDFTTEPGALLADYANYLWVNKKNHPEYHFPSFPNPVDSFRSLWIKINGPGSWDANPWVWVISFKVLSKTGKQSTIPSGFKSSEPDGTERLKSSPSGKVQGQVNEAHLLPGNGEGKEVSHA
jgi:hypothetical protein